MNGIFISYRRDDAPGYAGRLYDRLVAHFSADRVFMDVQGIEPGVDFVDAIEHALGSCEILIVLIGKDWLAADGTGRRRLDDPTDFVRLETATALNRGIRVVPVLVEGAAMPRAEQLPADLLPLVRRQAVELSHKQWDATSAELIRTLEKILDRDKPKGVAGPVTSPTSESHPIESSIGAGPPRPVAGSRAALYWGSGALLLLIVVVALYVTHPWRREVTPRPSPAVFSVTPDRVEFADQKVHVAGPSSVITLTNRGEAKLHVGSVRLEGPAAADFTLSENQCTNGELAPGVSCAMKVSFTPQAAGARTATLIIAAANAAANVAIQGRGSESTVAELPPPHKTGPPTAVAPTTPPERKPEAVAAQTKPAHPAITAEAPLKPPVERLIAVPNEIGKSRGDATADLQKAGLEARVVEGKADSKASGPADSVVTQSPKAGEQVKPGERVTLEIVPAAPAVAAVAPAVATAPTGFPRVGDRWEYNFRSMWKNVEPRTFVHQVTAVSDREVRETMSFVANGGKTSDSKAFAPESRLVEWRGQGYYFVEFNPFLQTFGALQPGTTWKALVTPIEDPFFSNWYSQGRVIGWESVSVPAGSFKALRVEVDSTRNASANSAAQAAPAHIRYVIWYSPDAKRTIKHVRTAFRTDSTRVAEDTYELVKYAVQ